MRNDLERRMAIVVMVVANVVELIVVQTIAGASLAAVCAACGLATGVISGWWIWGRRSGRYLPDGRHRAATCLGSRYMGDPQRAKMIVHHPCACTQHPDCDAGYCTECCKVRCANQCPAQIEFAIKITRKTGEPR